MIAITPSLKYGGPPGLPTLSPSTAATSLNFLLDLRERIPPAVRCPGPAPVGAVSSKQAWLGCWGGRAADQESGERWTTAVGGLPGRPSLGFGVFTLRWRTKSHTWRLCAEPVPHVLPSLPVRRRDRIAEHPHFTGGELEAQLMQATGFQAAGSRELPRRPRSSVGTVRCQHLPGSLCSAAVASTCRDVCGSVSGHLRANWKGLLPWPAPVLGKPWPPARLRPVGAKVTPAWAFGVLSCLPARIGALLSLPGCRGGEGSLGLSSDPEVLGEITAALSQPVWDFVIRVGGTLGSLWLESLSRGVPGTRPNS